VDAPPKPQPSFWHSPTFGTLCGLFAALGYTACNVCLRAAKDVDPFLISTLRAVPTVLMLAPLVALRPYQGLPLLPPLRVAAILLGTGLLAHVLGNSLFQYSLSVVGIALAVPLCLGSMIFSGATLGRIALSEPVTPLMATGLVLLITAICVLSCGAEAAGASVIGETAPAVGIVALGVTAAIASGVFYAIMGATLRYAAREHSTVAQSLTIVSTGGMIALALISTQTVSPQEWEALTAEKLGVMITAGVLNAVAFIALTRALQLTSLVYVHAINASQAAMAAVAGVVLFHEATSAFLTLGLTLTVLGLVLMHRGRPVAVV
jgi:drug/metabolite transporter (DMT)-like permease